jgi:hypothetical protein
MVMALKGDGHSIILAKGNTPLRHRISFNTHVDECERLIQPTIGGYNIGEIAGMLQFLQAASMSINPT